MQARPPNVPGLPCIPLSHVNKPQNSDETSRDAADAGEPTAPEGLMRGRSGEGVDSVLSHLREQEERRKPLGDH